MKKTKPLLLLALLPVLAISPAWSQPAGRGDGPPGGPRGFGGMRNSPKNRITRLIRGLERIEEDRKVPLNKAQAKKIVTIVSPWRTRKTMTDAQAKTVYTNLTNALTVAQKKALEDGPRGGRGGGPGGGFGGGGRGSRPDGPPPGGGRDGGRREGGRGPGGPGGMGGQRPSEAQMNAMRKMMASNNPLASPRLAAGFSSLPDRMQSRMVERYNDLDAFLKKLSQKAR